MRVENAESLCIMYVPFRILRVPPFLFFFFLYFELRVICPLILFLILLCILCMYFVCSYIQYYVSGLGFRIGSPAGLRRATPARRAGPHLKFETRCEITSPPG